MFYGGGFDRIKLKSQLRMASSQIQISWSKKSESLKNNMKEISILLSTKPIPKVEMARIRTKLFVYDDNLVQVYDIIKLECEILAERVQFLHHHQTATSPPPDVLSCISTLIYTAEIMKEHIPALQEIRKQFRAKYGGKFEQDAISNTGGVVNEKVVSKLLIMTKPPEDSLILYYMLNICKQFDIDWKPSISDSSMPSSTVSSTTVEEEAVNRFTEGITNKERYHIDKISTFNQTDFNSGRAKNVCMDLSTNQHSLAERSMLPLAEAVLVDEHPGHTKPLHLIPIYTIVDNGTIQQKKQNQSDSRRHNATVCTASLLQTPTAPVEPRRNYEGGNKTKRPTMFFCGSGIGVSTQNGSNIAQHCKSNNKNDLLKNEEFSDKVQNVKYQLPTRSDIETDDEDGSRSNITPYNRNSNLLKSQGLANGQVQQQTASEKKQRENAKTKIPTLSYESKIKQAKVVSKTHLHMLIPYTPTVKHKDKEVKINPLFAKNNIGRTATKITPIVFQSSNAEASGKERACAAGAAISRHDRFNKKGDNEDLNNYVWVAYDDDRKPSSIDGYNTTLSKEIVPASLLNYIKSITMISPQILASGDDSDEQLVTTSIAVGAIGGVAGSILAGLFIPSLVVVGGAGAAVGGCAVVVNKAINSIKNKRKSSIIQKAVNNDEDGEQYIVGSQADIGRETFLLDVKVL